MFEPLALLELLHDLNVQLVMAIILFTGIVRGFSGFGAGMLIGPTASALFSPRIALPMITILELLPTLPLVWQTRKNVVWSELMPVALGYALLVPLGVWVLSNSDATILRWFMCAAILAAVLILWSGYVYQGPRSKRLSGAFGGLGGFMGAAAALPGPPVLIYWLASGLAATNVRSNMVWYLFVTDLMVIVAYVWSDLYTPLAVQLGIVGTPFYFSGIAIGSYFFSKANEGVYRHTALLLIFLAVMVSLPIWDGLV